MRQPCQTVDCSVALWEKCASRVICTSCRWDDHDLARQQQLPALPPLLSTELRMTQTSANTNIFPGVAAPARLGPGGPRTMPHRAGAGCITHVRPKSLYFPCTRTTRNVGLAFGRSPCTKHLQVIVLGHTAGSPGRPRRAAIHPAQRGSQQTTYACNYYAARGALNPARPFVGLPAGGPWLHVCYSCTWPRLARPPLARVALGLEAAQRPCRFLTSSDPLGEVQ